MAALLLVAVAGTAGAAPGTFTPAVEPGASTVAARPAVPDETWDRLALCESSGNWAINTGNGFYGGLQIWLPTWQEAGGLLFATRPDLASRRQQIMIGEEILRRQGWEAWPDCARQLSLIPTDDGTPPAPQPTVPDSYVVQAGDTLGAIARRFKIPGGWQQLYQLNKDVIGPDPDRIRPGMRLRLH